MVHNDEVATLVGFNVNIFVNWFNAWNAARDVSNRGSRCNSHTVGVAHTVLSYRLFYQAPVEHTVTWHWDSDAAFFFLQIQSINWENTTIPLGATERSVSATFFGQQ